VSSGRKPDVDMLHSIEHIALAHAGAMHVGPACVTRRSDCPITSYDFDFASLRLCVFA
jgi:hypothetical protein